MKNKSPFHVVYLAAVCTLAAVISLSSCESDKGSDVVSAHKMEAILYDYHLAQGLAQAHSGDALIMLKYQTAILEKHGVSQEQFDASMAYYMRHAEQMHNIYERLSNRLGDEAVAQGSSLSEIGQQGTLTANGDTANVWKGQKAFVLNPYPPFNRMDFSVKADTTFHAGDRVMIEFSTQFIYQDGIRNAVAVLAMQFTNDSVATRVIRANSSSHYSLTLTDESHIGIKSVRGFFLLPPNSDDNSSNTTLRMALFNDIRLVRMHIKERIPSPTADLQEGDRNENNNVNGNNNFNGNENENVKEAGKRKRPMLIPQTDEAPGAVPLHNRPVRRFAPQQRK